MTGKILNFPRSRQVRPLTEGDVNASIQQIQMVSIERVVDSVADMMFEAVCRAGYCLTDTDGDDEVVRDHALIYNSLKSALFRKYGFHHHLQTIADDIYSELKSESDEYDDEEVQ